MVNIGCQVWATIYYSWYRHACLFFVHNRNSSESFLHIYNLDQLTDRPPPSILSYTPLNQSNQDQPAHPETQHYLKNIKLNSTRIKIFLISCSLCHQNRYILNILPILYQLINISIFLWSLAFENDSYTWLDDWVCCVVMGLLFWSCFYDLF